MRQMDRHPFLYLCFREPSLDPFLDPLGERSERLVGGDVGPGRSAFHALGIAEVKLAIPNLSRLKRAANLFFQALVKIRIDRLLAGQKSMERVGPGPRNPMYAAPQFGDIRQVIGP